MHIIKQGDFMDNIYCVIEKFSKPLKELFLSFDRVTLSSITEIRLRINKPIILYILDKPYFISKYDKLINYCTEDCKIISKDEFALIMNNLCNNSYHTNINTMIKGYVTDENGSRIGLAGEAVYKNNVLTGLRNISCVNIRISHDIANCSKKLLSLIYNDNSGSFIIAGPPSSGKTTMLRDIATILSSGYQGCYKKVSIIDERCEIAAGFDVGINSDVISNFPKAAAIEMAVRTLSPEIIICDEIGNMNEVEAIKFGFSCGASYIVSVHLKSIQDLSRNQILNSLIETGEFNYIVCLNQLSKDFDIIKIAEADFENYRNSNDNDFFYIPGNFNCGL